MITSTKGVILVNERIKKLRKMLDLTQQEFGNRIGMKQNTIALIEKGRNTSDQTIFSICREFNVNEEWLRNGTGEMFKITTSDALEALVTERNLTFNEHVAIEKFLNLSPRLRDGLINYFIEVAAAINSSDVSTDSPASYGAAIVDAEAAYEKSLGFVPNTDVTVSNTTDDTASTAKKAAGDK